MIRLGTVHDLESIAKINSDGWKANFNDELKGFSYENILERARQHKWTEQAGIDAYVYEENDRVLGYVFGKRDGKNCEIQSLYVALGAQGKGIGAKLFQFLKESYRESGCQTMIVKSLKTLPNRKFYEKQGGRLQEGKIVQIGKEEHQEAAYLYDL